MHRVFEVVCIGTSLTDSWSAHNWPVEAQNLAQVGRKDRVRFCSVGLQGMTSQWGLANVGLITTKRPSAVLIEFGINDPLNDGGSVAVSLPESYTNHAAMIDAIRAARADTAIFLMTMNPCTDTNGQAARRTNLAGYYAQYATIAAVKGVGLIDCYPTWLARGGAQLDTDIPDGSHPRIEALREVLIPAVVGNLAPLLR